MNLMIHFSPAYDKAGLYLEKEHVREEHPDEDKCIFPSTYKDPASWFIPLVCRQISGHRNGIRHSRKDYGQDRWPTS